MAVSNNYNSVNDETLEKMLKIMDDCSLKSMEYESKLEQSLNQLSDYIKINKTEVDNKKGIAIQNMRNYRTNFINTSNVLKNVITMYKDSVTNATKSISKETESISGGVK